MPPQGFEPTISAGERPQTYALDRAATGTGKKKYNNNNNNNNNNGNYTVNRKAKSSTPRAEEGYCKETTESEPTTHSQSHQALNIPRSAEVKQRMTCVREEIMDGLCCCVIWEQR